MFELDTYLNSTDFTNLCLALDFLPEDIDEIKQPVVDIAGKIVEQLIIILDSNMISDENSTRMLERIIKSIKRMFLN